NAERAAVFGEFRFEPVGADTDDIRILGGWQKANIKTVAIPQLAGVKGAPGDGKIALHQLVIEQVRGLFQAWDDAGLDDLLLSWAQLRAAVRAWQPHDAIQPRLGHGLRRQRAMESMIRETPTPRAAPMRCMATPRAA